MLFSSFLPPKHLARSPVSPNFATIFAEGHAQGRAGRRSDAHMVRRENITADDMMQRIDSIVRLLTDEQRAGLRACMSYRRYGKNEPIYSEGDVPQHLLCLMSGKVKIFKEGVGGRTQIIRVVKPVGFFGYRAHFANQNYVTAAAAFEPAQVCCVPMEYVERLVAQNIQLAQFFIRQLSVDLGVADQRTVSLTQKHIRGRLAEAILFLRDSYGLEEDEATLSIYLSREDLANLSNMTTSNAIRTLSAFSAERMLAIDGRKIKIIDEDRLKKISRIG